MCPVRSIFVDVDGTLINDKGELCEGVVARLETWADRYKLYCWSLTGEEWAKKVCIRHKIDKYFKAFLDKPDVWVDNEGLEWTKHGRTAVIRMDGGSGDWNKPEAELWRDSRDTKEDKDAK